MATKNEETSDWASAVKGVASRREIKGKSKGQERSRHRRLHMVMANDDGKLQMAMQLSMTVSMAT